MNDLTRTERIVLIVCASGVGLSLLVDFIGWVVR